MASFAKHITLFMLQTLLLSSTVQIQARESKFFSKIFHLGATISPDQLAPAPAPTPEVAASAPAPAPESGSSEVQDPYYGLYGQGSGMLPPKETANTFENELLAEELEGEKYERNKGYTYTTSNGYNKNNNGYSSSNYNSNGYNNNNNGYSSSRYSSSNGYESNERQGMSDTRFVEGGKYYYDVKNDNYYPNRYESLKEMTRNGGLFGNTDNYSSNEFMDSMDDQYQESQEDQYVP